MWSGTGVPKEPLLDCRTLHRQGFISNNHVNHAGGRGHALPSLRCVERLRDFQGRKVPQRMNVPLLVIATTWVPTYAGC